MVRSIATRPAEMSILVTCFSALLLCTRQNFAQSGITNPLDLFPQYQVRSSFKGKPAPPVLFSPVARQFRTMIREGVAKGVVFAGHYEVAAWGCGSGCLSFAVIDALTGKVTFFPASVSQTREAGERLTYKRNSKAIHIIGSLNEKSSADRWYVWDGEVFTLISEKPAILLGDDDDSL